MRDAACPFCPVSTEAIVASNSLAFAIRDRFPVTSLHTLVISRRHVADYFELHDSELRAMHRLLQDVREGIRRDDKLVLAFNVGANAGAVAGQTVQHCHLHLIPRRHGDLQNPRGGVRAVIPGKADYTVP
ncbi:MAG TPA: HIT family protein [Vicinamibacterales bacterium]|nr:HIT family protein [Vicinamibacterales bacterium]